MPSGSLDIALDILNNCLDQIPDLDKMETLIMGDFNADTADQSAQTATKISHFAISRGLECTRITGRKAKQF